MRNYIVFDLEWNQSAHGKADSVEDFPFEIIEIGAVKLNEDFSMSGEFHRLIKPQVYTQMHYVISEVTHMDMWELRHHGEDFANAVSNFIEWCGEDCVYCTWGSMDLTELQRNMKYFGVKNSFPKPLFYYDVQKLYARFYKDGMKPSLDSAVDELGLLEERTFHRALDDAYYTGKLLAQMAKEVGAERLLQYRSIDYFRLPSHKEEEVRMVFPDYSKYVSLIFDSKEAAMKERSGAEMKCYKCGRMLRKKVRWFTPNQKIYYGLPICPEHGYLKGKVRMKKVDENQVYVVKTLKLTDEEGAKQIICRKDDVRKKRAERSREKKKRQKKMEEGE